MAEVEPPVPCFDSSRKLLVELERSVRDHRPFRLEQANAAEAGVLVALTDDPCDPQVILTRRALHLSSHAGEVAFPGGKRDPEDSDLIATTLRETHEEIALAPDQVRVIGALDQVVSKHGYLVSPYLGVVSNAVELTANPDELDSVFQVPLRFLLDVSQCRLEPLQVSDELVVKSPHYHFQNYCIWGLTAYILVEMLNQHLAAELPFAPRQLIQRTSL